MSQSTSKRVKIQEEAKGNEVGNGAPSSTVAVTVGRQVHYLMATKPTKTTTTVKNEYGREVSTEHVTPNAPQVLTATVTAVNKDGTVNLCVFDDQNSIFRWPKAVDYAEKLTNGCWSWPARA